MKKFGRNILVFLIVIPVIIVLLSESISRIIGVPKISHHNIKAKSQDLIPKIDSNTILFLGDSRIEWGIKPLDIKKNLSNNDEVKVINLAFPGSNGLDILNYLKINSIYPKIIVLGYTPNYGRYTNHSFDKIIYSNKNRLIENIKYFLIQTSFLYDTDSFEQYIKGKQPYFKNHEYDDWGGATVTNYVDYKKRQMIQYDLYKEWFDTYDNKKLIDYSLSIRDYKKWFAKKETKIIGLYMPVSDQLFELEKTHYDRQNVLDIFNNNYYDYSAKYNASANADSLYFYDGSHLTPKTAISFSKELALELQKQP